MALTNAEKQKRWRERQKAIRAGLVEPDQKQELDTQFLLHGFYDWLDEDGERLESFNRVMVELTDLPPDELAGGKSGQEMIAINYTISVCLNAAITLAGMVSDFKRHKLMQRVESFDLADLQEGKAALMQEVAQLARMHDDYSRKSRAELQTWLLDSEASAMRALAASLDTDINSNNGD